LKIYAYIIEKIPNIDGRISPDDISSDSCITNLLFTKPGSKIPIIRINITTTEVQLDKFTFSISIIGTVDETESKNVPFGPVDIDQIIEDYRYLNPLIKEGISHNISFSPIPTRNASRFLLINYRMFDRMYEEEEYGYEINEDEIAESVLPYIVSMHDIYSRIYPGG
jgi:hypothetical protein